MNYIRGENTLNVDGSDDRLLKTVESAVKIVNILEDLNGARVSEISEEIGKSKSTVHGYLKTLRKHHLVIKEGDFYFPGPEFLRIGDYVSRRKKEYRVGREYAEELFDNIGHRVSFAVEMEGRVVLIHTATGSRKVWPHERTGSQLFLHNSAIGKAILAEKPEECVDEIIEKWGLPKNTDKTITNKEDLLEELETIQDVGYALNRGETFERLRAIAVAAVDSNGDVLGAFTVSCPPQIFKDEEERQDIISELKTTVEEFELDMTMQG